MGALANVSTAQGERADGPGRVVSRNPATGEVLGEVPEQGPAEVKAAVQRARAAQAAWGALSPRERGKRMLAFRDLLIKRADEVCAAIAREGGKTRLEALSMEVTVVVDLTTYFAKRVHKLLAPEPISLHLLKTRASYLHYVPRGVVGIIAPWNFPFSIPVGCRRICSRS
jgi:succinate-semialdehyde dehydrogenase/glutarate-semialdehyde dehydrogenase